MDTPYSFARLVSPHRSEVESLPREQRRIVERTSLDRKPGISGALGDYYVIAM